MVTHEPVGSLAEEAAKLVAALQGWASDHRGAPTDDAEPAAPDQSPEDAGGADGARAAGYVAQHESGQHGSAECRYCPLCNLARFAKAASPEVRDHLSNAALSMALAIKGLLEGVDQHRADRRDEPVEKIDLVED